MKKVRDRSSSLFRAGRTVASPIGKLGQRTLDAGQSEVKQLWGFIERAFYPKDSISDEDGTRSSPANDGNDEEQRWEETPEGLEEVNIFLDHLGGVSEADTGSSSSSTTAGAGSVGADATGSDLSSAASFGSTLASSSSGVTRHGSALTSSSGSPRPATGQHHHQQQQGSSPPSAKGASDSSGNNAFVVKIKKGKDMAHKIMFYGVEKMTHLGRSGHKKKKDHEPDGLVEPRAVVGLCGKRGAEPALIEVSMGCIISCGLQFQGSVALPKKLKHRRMLTKNTPRVLFGKQEGWVLELYIPPQLTDADTKKKKKDKKDKHKKEAKKNKEKAHKERTKEKEKKSLRESLTSSASSVEGAKVTPKRKRSASSENTTEQENAEHSDLSQDEHKDNERKDKKGKAKEQYPAQNGHHSAHTEAEQEEKERSNSVVVHDTETEKEELSSSADADALAELNDDWFQMKAEQMANWEKLELAARTPHQIMAWRHFFWTGLTEDGRKEISGFLWVKQKDSWDRYYCVADQDRIEWLKPAMANLIPLTSLTNLRRGILTEKEQRKLQTKKKKEDWDRSHYLSKIILSKYKLTLLKQNEPLFSFVTPSRNILIAIATHIIAQKGLDNMITHHRTLLDEVDCAKAVSTKAAYKIKRNSTFSKRKKSELKGREPTLVPIHRRSVSNSDTIEFDDTYSMTGRTDTSLPQSARADVQRSQHFFDGESDDTYSEDHYLRISTIEETKETTKLRNELRDAHERAVLEIGKTPYGNVNLDKKRKLSSEEGTVDKSNKDFFILSLDGGGLRGVILTTLLVRLVEVFPDLMERVDLFSGVSAGSIVASCLATGRSPVFMQKMLRNLGPILFMARNVRQFHGYPLRQAKYSTLNLKIVLEESLRGATLSTCPRNVLISTFLLDNHKEGGKRSWDPRVYHNLPRVRKEATTSESDYEDDETRAEEDKTPSYSGLRQMPNHKHTKESVSTPTIEVTNGRRRVIGHAQSEKKVEMRGRNLAGEVIAAAEIEAKRRKHTSKNREGTGSKEHHQKEHTPKHEDAIVESTANSCTKEGTSQSEPIDGAQAKEAVGDETRQGSPNLPEGIETPVGKLEKQRSTLQGVLPRWPSRKTNQPSSDRDLRVASPRQASRSQYQDGTNNEPDSSKPTASEPYTDLPARERFHSRQSSIDLSMLNRRMSSKLEQKFRRHSKQPVSTPLFGKRELSISSADLADLEDSGKGNPKSAKEFVDVLEVNNDTLLMDLVLASAAAPTFFPSHRCHVDGAIVANNPSLAAISTVLSPDTIGTPKVPSKVHVLSIGTGYITRFIETNNDHDWGVLQWAPWLSELMLYSAQMNATKLSATLLGDNFHRLDPLMEKAIPMDDPALMPLLEEKAMEVDLSQTIAWIKQHVYGEKAAAPSPAQAEGKPKAKSKKKKKRVKGDQSTRGQHTKRAAGELPEGDMPQGNMHWGTDAWFAAQRMWEG